MSGSRPRLVHVTTTDISLELLLGQHLRAFRDAGYDVIAMSAPGPFADALVADGIEFVGLQHASRAIAFGSDLRAGRELYGHFRALRPDIVHTHNPKPGIYGRLAARAARVPAIVNTVHGLYAQPDDALAKRAAVYSLERIAAFCSHAELVQNPEDLETLAHLGVPRRKLHQLGNGIDLRRFRPGRLSDERRGALRAEMGAGPDDVVCGVVARLVWEKGYRELFAAAAALRDRYPQLRVVAVGETDHDKADAVTPADIDAAERESGVHFLGHRSDVEDLYAAFDVSVLASHREGFPRTPMEAAATGVPVVATDIRGCRQVVDDGVTGLLVPRADAPALARAIETLVVDSARRAQMGVAALDKARREFDQQRQIDITLDVYRALTGRARAAAA
ncbi:MAG TPA: glycosyltransferase family 4 protein [Acidimicrobiia bacterium]|nr:glycosyltransferase family 4 protein [Acidimicrobiia bacterium]